MLVLSVIKTVFRRCPNCGRLFEIRIAGRKLVDEKVFSDKFRDISPDSFIGGRVVLPNPTLMTEGIITVDEKEFQYAYECKHCGHKWFEIVEKKDESVTTNRSDL